MTTKDEILNAIVKATTSEWNYLSEANSMAEAEEMAPAGADVEEGPRGGFRYQESGSGGGGGDEGAEGADGDSPDYTPNPEEDMQRFHESDETTEMIADTNEAPQNGFTVQRNLEPYDYWSEDAWTVGLTSIEVSTDEGLSKEDVTDFYQEWVEVLEEEPALRIGGYHFKNGEKISVDLSAMVEDKEEAEDLGEELKQESIFHPKKAMESDFEEGSEDTYEGEDVGESPIETPEDVRNYLSEVDSLKKRALIALRKALAAVMKDDTPDLSTRYESEEGRVLTRRQIGMTVRYENADVERTEDGFIVDGVRFTRVQSDE